MFIETRGNDGVKQIEVPFSYALLNPSASFGGLYIPKEPPLMDANFLQNATKLNYKELSLALLKSFHIDVADEVLEQALSLYDAFDNKDEPVSVVQIKDDLFINELYHGPTRAFKDMALQPFGYILADLAAKEQQKYLILAATSGDTGPATLATFANKKNIQVACMYPDGGTSDVQRLQMVTNSANNLKVIGIKGNFDDAQNALKMLLASDTFKAELIKDDIKLSAANSVNFGRIIFQIIYHIYGYISLLKSGKINLGDAFYDIIPSGNFGNALGAYYAKKMGLPIRKILIASNINNILTDLLTTGVYDLRDRKLLATSSPAMDILISSNVERILADKFGQHRCRELMDSLAQNRYYKLSNTELQELQKDFAAVYSDDAFAKNTIKKYADDGYVLDPHTATCLKAYETLKKEPIVSIICSTAEWTKFAPTMLNALENNTQKYTDLEALKGVSEALHVSIPECISNLFEQKVVHDKVIEKEEIEEEILAFISQSRLL